MKRLLPLGCMLLFGAVLMAFSLPAEESPGSIHGDVLEQMTRQPIPGILVQVQGTKLAVLSDEKGGFRIAGVPPGNYNVRFSGEGYVTWIETDVIVRSKRITVVHVRLDEQMPQIQEHVEVTGSYFHQDDKNPLGVVNLSPEEVRRAPGSAGGITRVLKALPGITTASDDDTDLVVRGGSPFENGYIMDNIEFPTIDHLPNLASSGGSFSALNSELIRNVDFYSGGFSADYGGCLSSVTDISLREGNRREFDGRMDINMSGAGFTFEGPVAKERGSWLVSFKKSYFNFLRKIKLLDISAIPVAFDAQAKLTYDLGPTQKLSLLYFHLDGEMDEEGVWIKDLQKYSLHTVGCNWTANWNPRFFSNTSLAFSSFRNRFGEFWDFQSASAPELDPFTVWDMNDMAETVSLRNSNCLVLGRKSELEFGLQVKWEKAALEENNNPESKPYWTPRTLRTFAYQTGKYGLFFSYVGTLFKRLTASAGARGDFSSAQGAFHLSPRFSWKYQILPELSVHGGAGVFFQTLPMSYLAYIPGAAALNDMKATHYTLGLEMFLGAGAKVTLEWYSKSYDYLPISPKRPLWLAMDYTVARFRDNQYTPVGYRVERTLTGGGSGYSRGVEFFLQKKLVKNFYGFLSASYFRSRYKDLNGATHNRVYDNRVTLNLSCGYKPNRLWEFSAKWTLIGGGPYTPYDVAQSTENFWPVYDATQFLMKRFPAYSSVNLRVDKRFYFGGSSLTLYLDLWNAFNRKNVLFYWWDSMEKRVRADHQLEILPIVGVEFEF